MHSNIVSLAALRARVARIDQLVRGLNVETVKPDPVQADALSWGERRTYVAAIERCMTALREARRALLEAAARLESWEASRLRSLGGGGSTAG